MTSKEDQFLDLVNSSTDAAPEGAYQEIVDKNHDSLKAATRRMYQVGEDVAKDEEGDA